ncbi:hypothetical protein JKA74_08670 [Marivirga sp. S37H4]|uniref:ABM domain-containing protein n=1 Tax=Marivirga aurantiaca TaxID=2802615 RepID=A0A934WXS3_9BACT|nr:hypothetical protein [Marivirga aurantiaca]MBK6265109.1 hypothetical protein [Marivirga aurantiaca]
MEKIVIVGYRPFPGKESQLMELMNIHWQTLDKENLVSARKPVLMKSLDGTVIEVFGWKSKEAMDLAHSNETVLKIWEKYAEVCEYVPIAELTESKHIFSEFSPLN